MSIKGLDLGAGVPGTDRGNLSSSQCVPSSTEMENSTAGRVSRDSRLDVVLRVSQVELQQIQQGT